MNSRGEKSIFDFDINEIQAEVVETKVEEVAENPKPKEKATKETKTVKKEEKGTVETPKQEIQVAEEKTTQLAQPKQSLVNKFLTKVVEYAEESGQHLDQKTKALAVDIITQTNKKLVEKGSSWGEVNVSGCGFISQIKRWASLGVSAEDKLFIDIRNNKETGLKDIVIKGQYQTIEKLMIKYCSKPIVRFKEDIICTGDQLIEEEDFATGLNRITKHIRNNKIDRNNIDNIIGAYKIAYVLENNTLVPYTVKIDQNRIKRAYNASPSNDKGVWKLDSKKMVLKTCTWEMWNDKNIRAYMIFPDEIRSDLSILEESEEMNWQNPETKYQSVNQAQDTIQSNIGTDEPLDVEFEEI